MKHISFPKIGQFRNVVADIKHYARFNGLDENDQPIYNNDLLPTVTFTGTVKLHGTNAAVCLQGNEIWAQSRELVIEKGHFGFVDFVQENISQFMGLFNNIKENEEYTISKTDTISIFGEWAGPGIQKSVGISNIEEKMFFVFGIKVTSAPLMSEDDIHVRWIDHSRFLPITNRIRNIFEFPHFEKDIDFNNPQAAINELVGLTEKVEESCPVANKLGAEGIGEGIVWVGQFKGKNFRFKVKGEKHSNTKVKKLASVDPEKLKSIEESVEYLVTKQRYEQALHVTGARLDRKDTGVLMKWLANDIISEETDTLEANGLQWKDISGRVTDAYRRMFFNDIDTNL